MEILVEWKGNLSPNTVDTAMDVAEYAYPKTIEGAWKRLDSLLEMERITKTTYNEIKNQVTFVYNID
jgi:hypothetical protein